MKFGYGYDKNGILVFQFIADLPGEDTAFNELDTNVRDPKIEIKLKQKYKSGMSELRLLAVPIIEEAEINEADQDTGDD